MKLRYHKSSSLGAIAAGLLVSASPGLVGPAHAQEKRPNIVMLMTDDTGWNDFGAYRTIGEQTFYLVKLHFPRGDAASLLFGFNAEGKITGIGIMSMAGD
jgi:hypothetical protein